MLYGKKRGLGGLSFALALFIAALTSLASAQDLCFSGTRAEARFVAQQRLGLVCQLICTGCGCKGGPGLRKPPPGRENPKGDCAKKSEVAAGVCGEGPSYDRCTHECTPLHAGCVRGALPADTSPAIKIDEGLNLFEVTGEDQQGRRAAFDIIMISEGLSFKYKKDDEMVQGRDPVSAASLREFFKMRFGASPDIIAAGTASSEGSRKIEESRALRRAVALSSMVAESATPTTKLWALNLGQHLQLCSGCSTDQSAYQRPVFVIGVAFKENDAVNLGEALRMALTRRIELPKPDRFSLFELYKIR